MHKGHQQENMLAVGGTHSVEVLYATGLETGSNLGRGDDSCDGVTVPHGLTHGHNVRHYT